MVAVALDAGLQRSVARVQARQPATHVVQADGFAGAVGRNVWHIGIEKDHGFFTDIPDAHRDAAPIRRVPLEQAEGIIASGPFDELNETPED